MQLLKILLLILITTNLNASRIKKDLIPEQEQQIISLLKEKISIVDTLITEAKIYQSDKDLLIQKGFFGSSTAFVTKAVNGKHYVQTGIGSSVVSRRANTSAILGSTQKQDFYSKIKRPKSELYRESNTRDIFNISMQRRFDVKTSFSNNINYIYLLGQQMEEEIDFKSNIPKQKLVQTIDKNIEKEIQPLTTTLLKKYLEFIDLLSDNNLAKPFRDMLKSDKVYRWTTHSRMFVIELDLMRKQNLKKKNYELSIALHNAFENLKAKQEITVTKIPHYYDRKIDKNLHCLETSQDIKYKGRICLNPIDVDNNVYFKYGTFESRENNFIQQNKDTFISLIALDDKLKKASRDYVKFILLTISSKKTHTKAFSPSSNKISIDGGL